jgi:hypothetical protein
VDPDGKASETAWDAISLGMGVRSLVHNIRTRNIWGAFGDGVGVLIDGAALAFPGIPGGVGYFKAAKAVNTISDGAKVANAVDDAANCTFFFPSIVRKGPLVAAVSSGGNCPAATQVLRDAIAPLMTDGLVNETIRLGAMRDQLKKEFPDHTERGKYCREQLEKSW